MKEGQLLQIGSQAMIMAAELAAPLSPRQPGHRAARVAVPVRHIQEVTLTFVPKLVATALVLVIGGHWMLTTFAAYVDQLFGQIDTLLGG